MSTARAELASPTLGLGSTRARLLAVAVGSALFVACYALPNVGPLDRGENSDIAVYERYAAQMLDGSIPYRDFFVLYPPGALPVFLVPALGGGDFAVRFKVLQWAIGLGAVVAVVLAASALGGAAARLVAAAAFVGLAPAALGEAFVASYDIWPAFLTAAALAAVLAGRERLGFASLGAAAAAKLYPVLLLPLAFWYVRRRAGPRHAWIAAGVFALAVLALVLPFAVASPGGLKFSLSIQAERGLHLESLGAGFLLAAHQLGAYHAVIDHYLDSQNLGGAVAGNLARLSMVLQLVAVCAVATVFFRRRADAATLVLAAAAMVAGVVAFGKVLSPQYLVWLVPLVAVAIARWVLPAVVLAAALVLTQLWYPTRFGALLADLDPVASWLILARGLVLVGLFGILLALLRAQPRASRHA